MKYRNWSNLDPSNTMLVLCLLVEKVGIVQHPFFNDLRVTRIGFTSRDVTRAGALPAAHPCYPKPSPSPSSIPTMGGFFSHPHSLLPWWYLWGSTNLIENFLFLNLTTATNQQQIMIYPEKKKIQNYKKSTTQQIIHPPKKKS